MPSPLLGVVCLQWVSFPSYFLLSFMPNELFSHFNSPCSYSLFYYTTYHHFHKKNGLENKQANHTFPPTQLNILAYHPNITSYPIVPQTNLFFLSHLQPEFKKIFFLLPILPLYPLNVISEPQFPQLQSLSFIPLLAFCASLESHTSDSDASLTSIMLCLRGLGQVSLGPSRMRAYIILCQRYCGGWPETTLNIYGVIWYIIYALPIFPFGAFILSFIISSFKHPMFKYTANEWTIECNVCQKIHLILLNRLASQMGRKCKSNVLFTLQTS